jgi:hypothetical protein
VSDGAMERWGKVCIENLHENKAQQDEVLLSLIY